MHSLTWTLWEPPLPYDTAVILLTFPGETLREEMLTENAALITVTGFEWNHDLTPWPAPKAFARGEDFGGRAPALLKTLREELLPEIRGRMANPQARLCLMGASLAGLFALWAACEGEEFRGAASVSGSFWYPDCMAYFRERLPREGLAVYLSLGDREEKSRNPVFASIGENTRALVRLAGTMLVMHPGNHFQNGEQRLAAAFNALVGMMKE